MLHMKLVINGGRKNENACQVGYSAIIEQLLKGSLNEKQKNILKKELGVESEIAGGKTILHNTCSYRTLNKEIELLSSTLCRLMFTKEKIDPVVSSISEHYLPENISAPHLSHLFKELAVFGAKDPLGRNYCQYQIQKVVPEELREFYLVHYTPTVSSLVISGNFNMKAVKRTISKHFVSWKTLRKEEDATENTDVEIPKIKGKEITFVNKTDSKDHLLKWVRSAPSSHSPDHPAFLVACKLFDKCLKEKTIDSSKFSSTTVSDHLTETNCVVSENELISSIHLFDTILQNFHNTPFTVSDLEVTLNKLKNDLLKKDNPESILSFYDPLTYNFELQKNYLKHLNNISVSNIEMVRKKYFDPNSYKLIVVGKEHVVREQLKGLENVVHYETSDFETCNEACKEIIIVQCHCESCYRRGYCNIWRFDPSKKESIKNAKSRAKYTAK